MIDGDSIDQFDATTGALEHSFGPAMSNLYPAITISADRRTLFLGSVGSTGNIFEYDISTSTPALIAQLSGFYYGLAPSPDSKFLYYLHSTAGSLLRARLPSLSPVRLVNSNPYFDDTGVGLEGSIYESVDPPEGSIHTPSGSYSIFDPISLRQTAAIPLGNLQVDYPYYPGPIVFDNSGKYFFANVNTQQEQEEIWVFSTDLASYPPPKSPDKESSQCLHPGSGSKW